MHAERSVLPPGPHRDALEWIDGALSLPGADGYPALRVRALCDKAWCLWPLGRGDERPAVMDEAEAIARRLADPVLLSRVLEIRATHEGTAGRLGIAARFADESLDRATAAEDDWGLAMAAMARAIASVSATELRERTDRAVALREQVGNVHLLADLLASAAYRALCQRSDRDAHEFVDGAIRVMRDLDNAYPWMLLQGNLGLAQLVTGDADAREAFREQRTVTTIPSAPKATSTPDPGRRAAA